MHNKTSVVITTINKINENIINISKNCKKKKWSFHVVGDKKTPKSYKLPFGNFWSVKKQTNSNFKLAKKLPLNSYTRKNLGYLFSISEGADIIIETDDDNYPYKSFYRDRKIKHNIKIVKDKGFYNVYRFYLEDKNIIWQRGFPIENILDIKKNKFTKRKINCFLQQGLCNGNPDVDAIYRLMNKNLNIKFKDKTNLGVTGKTFSPTNSQNTTWFKDSFPLMYLPSFCSMRATDIWRGIIAQFILNKNNQVTLFHSPNIKQIRNQHNLQKDLLDEIEVYTNIKRLIKILETIKIKKGSKNYIINLKKCYEVLCGKNFFPLKELELLNLWIEDLSNCFKTEKKTR